MEGMCFQQKTYLAKIANGGRLAFGRRESSAMGRDDGVEFVLVRDSL